MSALRDALPERADALAATLYLLSVRADADADCRLYLFPGGALGLDGDQGTLVGCASLRDALCPGSSLRREAAWLGIRTLLCRRGLLPRPDAEPLLVMRRNGNGGAVSSAPSSERPAENAAEAVRILADATPVGMERDAQERAYWLFSLFRRRELGGAFVLDGAVACLFRTPYGFLLENVATRPALRGQGRASRLLDALFPAGPLSDEGGADGLASFAGEPVFLLCDPALESFYAKHGFRRDGFAQKRRL